MKTFLMAATVGYVIILGLIVAGMLAARRSADTTMSTPEAQRAWEKWRDDVEQREASKGTVSRRIPKSSEPPMRVLLRDHFEVSLAGTATMASAFYWTLVLLLRGATNPTTPITEDQK